MHYCEQSNTIISKRLVLRHFMESDAKALVAICNNYNIYKSTMHLPFPYTMKHATNWIKGLLKNTESERIFQFAITDRENGALLGSIALNNNEEFKQGEISYMIDEVFWGNGYATEAAQAMIDFAFEEKGYHKVFARYFLSNPASGKVLEKVGMKQEGLLIDHVKKDDIYEDLVFYGLINPREVEKELFYEEDCIFCNPKSDPNQNIILENKTCYFLQHNREQDVLEGCGVIVPKVHRNNTFDLTKEEWSDTYDLLQLAKEYVDGEFSPDGYTLGFNVGKVSNQSIPHCHFHVIPRYNDEAYAGKGLRNWLKRPENKRKK